jgi:RNA polymerase sigma factor (sigma-70 family)
MISVLERCRNGDSSAFGEIVEHFQSAALSWAYDRLGNWHDSEDAVQDAFVSAYCHLGDLRELRGFPGWLRRIVHTSCSRQTRRMDYRTVDIDDAMIPAGSETDPLRHTERSHLKGDILSAIRALSRPQRDCVALHYLHDYPIPEIATRLKVPVGTVKRRLHDGRKAMRITMAHHAPERKQTMIRELKGLKTDPSWVSWLGCLRGCLNYLGADMSRGWLFGGTGHAFIINMAPDVCPSGPTAWDSDFLVPLSEMVGARTGQIHSYRGRSDLDPTREAAWAYVRGCLDRGIPCFGWELGCPEYQVIYGYDDEGYYFQGPSAEEGAGPIPWQKLATSEIGVLELYSVERCDPEDDATIVREACKGAILFADNDNNPWRLRRYRTGISAFEAWANALENGTAMDMGARYNGEVWSECRGMTVAFLDEARERLNGRAGDLLTEASAHYAEVSDRMKQARDLHPFDFQRMGTEPIQRPDIAALIREAIPFEQKGLDTLAHIVEELK